MTTTNEDTVMPDHQTRTVLRDGEPVLTIRMAAANGPCPKAVLGPARMDNREWRVGLYPVEVASVVTALRDWLETVARLEPRAAWLARSVSDQERIDEAIAGHHRPAAAAPACMPDPGLAALEEVAAWRGAFSGMTADEAKAARDDLEQRYRGLREMCIALDDFASKLAAQQGKDVGKLWPISLCEGYDCKDRLTHNEDCPKNLHGVAALRRALFSERQGMLAERAIRKDAEEKAAQLQEHAVKLEAVIAKLKTEHESRIETALQTWRDERELRSSTNHALEAALEDNVRLKASASSDQHRLAASAATVEAQGEALARAHADREGLLADIDRLERMVLYQHDVHNRDVALCARVTVAAVATAPAHRMAEYVEPATWSHPAYPEGIPDGFLAELAARRHHVFWSAPTEDV